MIVGVIGVWVDDFLNFFSGGIMMGLINLGFFWNFLNYGWICNNVWVQDVKFQEVLLNYENIVLLVYVEVENVLIGFLCFKQQVVYLCWSFVVVCSLVGEVEVQYEDGMVFYNWVVDVQKNLFVVEECLIVVQVNVFINFVVVYKGLGGGWVLENVDGLILDEIW